MTVYPPHIAHRMADIEPFHVMELLARARHLEAQGRSIVHMEIGEPDFVTPDPVIRAGQRALDEGYTHYTPALGLDALREAIAAYYESRYGIAVPARRIVVTPGASGALQLVFGVLIDPGDKVLMADPGYPCNRHFVRLMEGEAVAVPVGPETDYQLTDELVIHHWSEGTVATLLASPSNPTGTLIAPAAMRRIASETYARGAQLIVDEIYQGLVYDDEVSTALATGNAPFVVNSFSKYFGMTGWRIGWLVAPEDYVREIEKLAQNIFLAASTPAQHAALACFHQSSLDILEQRRETFRRRRDFLLPALRELGFRIPVAPRGAFYLYADCSAFTDDSFEFAGQVLEEAGVAITPGVDFGRNEPRRHVRFAYTTSLEKLEEGVQRLRSFLARL